VKSGHIWKNFAILGKLLPVVAAKPKERKKRENSQERCPLDCLLED